MRRLCLTLTGFFCFAVSLHARAAVGWIDIPASLTSGLVSVLYPTQAPEQDVKRGSVVVQVAPDAAPGKLNGALVVISHGSPSSPWFNFDVARALVDAGFVVAMPEHFGDNAQDASDSGPPSWIRRPLEVSRAVDAVAQHELFGPLLQFENVGMYGMSAGGHTALTLAGGRWSPARLRRHCDEHIAEDFQTCVGPRTNLTGGWFDGVKVTLARWLIDLKLTDDNWYEHTDPRITAVVAGVPLAADFEPSSLAHPKVHLGIVSAEKDSWLVPRFHSGFVLNVCKPCEHVADIPKGGHGALLSPLPPMRTGLLADLTADPTGFNRRTVMPQVNRQIAAFFTRHLLKPKDEDSETDGRTQAQR